MRPLVLILALALILAVLWDGFETIILPRTVSRRVRVSRAFYRLTWRPWARVAAGMTAESQRERFLAIYGPSSMIALMIVWAVALIVGFGALYWALGARLDVPTGHARFVDDLYMSGSALFTLGVEPKSTTGRIVAIVEGGTGLAFLAIVVSYLPVVYQSFSRREARLTLLDAWAGSPPAALEVLRRLGPERIGELGEFLRAWEYWCSDLLESHISYPVVAYFRSQHQKQSWVAALTAVLDVTALIQAGVDGVPTWQAHVTFAIARHAAVDLAQVLKAPVEPAPDRLADADLEQARALLEERGFRPARSPSADAALRDLRRSYEPFVNALSKRLMMPLPRWWRLPAAKDNWEATPKLDGAHL